MKGDHVFFEYATANDIVRVGDIYVNAQGIELEVSYIVQPANSRDVFVELLPLDDLLIGRRWYGEFLMELGKSSSGGQRLEGGIPRIYVHDMHRMYRTYSTAENDRRSAYN